MYNTKTTKSTKSSKSAKNNKLWSPRPEKPVKKTSSKKNGQAKFVDQMKKTRKALYYQRTAIPANSNITYSENGAIMYKSSGSALVDINFKISAMREMEEGQIVALFRKAYAENPRLAMRWLGYLTDIRGGLGERRSSMVILKDMMNNGGAKMVSNIIELIPEYGRWDMIYNFIGNPVTSEKVKNLIKRQMAQDKANMKAGKSISLMAKWLKTATKAGTETRKLGLWTVHALGMTEKQYRQTLSSMRKYIDVVERKMSSNNWQAIDYETVPSKANLNYNKAFFKHDEIRRKAYLDALSKGEAKINSSVANPCEIVNKYHGHYYGWGNERIKGVDEALEGMWKALPNLIPEDSSMLVVADGSGSMTSRCSGNISCLDVANAMAIYCADRAKGAYANKYITFSMTPKFVEFDEDWTLARKLNEAYKHSECANTNLEAVFNLILQTAITNHSPQRDLPKNILIISDMQFDAMCSAGAKKNCYGWHEPVKVAKSFIDEIEARFAENGYQLPKIIYWNIAGNGRKNVFPITQDDRGVMVSGYSVNTLHMVMSGKANPFEAILDVITTPRYTPFEKALA